MIAHTAPANGTGTRTIIMVLLGLAIMVAILLAPTPEGLSLAGQRVIAIMAFTVFMWITEAIPYGVSAVSLIFLLIVGLGFSPPSGATGGLLGTAQAVPLALSGFSNSGWLFVAAGLAMAAAITCTGLEKRVAYMILRLLGTRTNSIMLGIIVTAFVLTFLIPSVIARAATMVPITIGLVEAFGLPRDSQTGKAMLLLAGILPSVTGVAVLTGAAPNPVIVNFLAAAGEPRIGYVDWFLYLFPFTVVYALALFFLVTRLFKFELDDLPGGKEYLATRIRELGPMSAPKKRALVIMTVTILLWATDKLHHIEASAISVFSVLLLTLPLTGVISCNELYKRVDWNSILLFGAGISMAEILTKTGGAAWLAKVAFVEPDMAALSVTMLAVTIFVVVFFVRFCFTSITSCLTAITPAIIGFLVTLHDPAVPISGIVLGVSLVAQCLAILPVTSAPAMIAYGAGGFTTNDMIKLGLPLALVMYAIIFLCMITYWPAVGL
jgi:solute carrier family 13 (sodium-dependent dicarboxylate transporter), member 2/3/5